MFQAQGDVVSKIRYQHYVVRKGRGYWLVTPKMKAMGFHNIRCGKDGPQAREIADEWEKRWQAARRGLGDSGPRKQYPKNTLGDAFDRFRRTNEWIDKPPRTKEDWERGWKLIEPYFGDLNPKFIGLEELDSWYGRLRKRYGDDKAGRGLKTWRALYPKLVGFKLADDPDPSLALTKHNPSPRTEVWSEGEWVRLVKAAIRMNYHGLACIMAVTWDTIFQPGDTRGLTLSHIHASGDEWAFPITRGKTKKRALGILCKRTKRLVEAYLNALPFELTPNAHLFYTRGSQPGDRGGRPHPPVPYRTNSLNKDFATVRRAVFGEGEKRLLMDTRRSGAREVDAGGAKIEDVAAKMGNNIDESAFLQQTYLGVSVARVRAADESRKVGRRRLASEQNMFKKLKLHPRKS